MLKINKTESLEFKVNVIVTVTGILLVTGFIIYSRGFNWFTGSAWSQISIIKYVIAITVLVTAIALQYYFLMLFRYSTARILVFWLLPAIWLFNNCLVAIHRLFESSAEATSLTGWVPITDLIGWLLGVVFVPLFLAGGVIVAIIDSGGFMLSQVCNLAGMVVDITGNSFTDIISGSSRFLGTFMDLLVDSFMDEVIRGNSTGRAFLDLSLSGIFNLPNWLFSAGYSFSCIIG